MNKFLENNKGKALLFASFAVNIFLIAFVIGRLSAPAFPFDYMRMHMPPEMAGDLPPHMTPREMSGERPRHPPFFGPENLFDREELRKNLDDIKPDFEKIKSMRRNFEERLKSTSVTKEEILKHFSEVDDVMDKIRKNIQEKSADKILSMTPEEREEFVKNMQEREPYISGTMK